MERLAAITFDMDELDVLAEGYGIAGKHPKLIYERAVPRMLELLDEADLPATFFVIGKDIEGRNERLVVQNIAESGHEIGSHSYSHRHMFDLSSSQTFDEVKRNHELLSEIIGISVVGHRAPSLTLNEHLLEILQNFGYEYDSSANPTIFFLAEWIYLSLFNVGSRNRLRWLYVQHALAPSNPYPIAQPDFLKSSPNGSLIQLPIAHVPWLQVPYYATFHFMFPWTRKLLKSLFLTNRVAVYHAHALDFLDVDQDDIPDAFRRHPSLARPWSERQAYFRSMFLELKDNYHVQTARSLAQSVRDGAA